MAQDNAQVKLTTEIQAYQIVPTNMSDLTEAEIWKKFKFGDEAAFIWIYREYFDKLYAFGRQFDIDSDRIKDHIQELFIYIRNSRNRLADVKSIKYYLYKSLRRRLLADKKKKFALFSIFQGEIHHGFEIELSESPERMIIDQSLSDEIKRRISGSLNKLTVRQREAVLYFYYEGLSYLEIKEIMELKRVKSARKLIYRAIEALRKDFQGTKSTLYK